MDDSRVNECDEQKRSPVFRGKIGEGPHIFSEQGPAESKSGPASDKILATPMLGLVSLKYSLGQSMPKRAHGKSQRNTVKCNWYRPHNRT